MGIMWCMRPSAKERERINRGRSNDGTVSQVEDTTPLDDDYDVNIRLAGSGVVHAPAGPDKRTSRSSECSHGGHDRCICGLAESRKSIV